MGPEIIRRRVWRSLHATVVIGPGFIHRAGFDGLLIPHPPFVNSLLRRYLPDKARNELIFEHEFAHFKTLPAALLYVLALVAAVFISGTINTKAMTSILISGHALWEMLSEGFVIITNAERYRHCYQDVAKFPRIVFWSVSLAVLAAGLMILYC